MTDINWIDQRGYCDSEHPGKRNGRWGCVMDRTAVRKFIKSNGSTNYELVCLTPGCRFVSSPVPSDIGEHLTTRLPVLETRYSQTFGDVCCYDGCGSTEIEWHHFAPCNVFGEEADRFPVQPLCREHHQHWHRTMDGYQWRARSVEWRVTR